VTVKNFLSLRFLKIVGNLGDLSDETQGSRRRRRYRGHAQDNGLLCMSNNQPNASKRGLDVMSTIGRPLACLIQFSTVTGTISSATILERYCDAYLKVRLIN
jgi:hypothetical protein